MEVKSGFRIRWRNPGGQAGSYTVADKQQARRLCAEAGLAEKEGKDWVPPSRRRAEGLDEPIVEAAARWVALLNTKGRAPRTIEAYARAVGGLVDSIKAARRGEPTVASLTPAAVTTYLNERMAKVKNPAGDANAIRGFASFLARGPLRDAMEQVKDVCHAPKAPPRVIRVGFAQLDVVISHLGRPGSTAYTFAAIGRCAGLRANEILSLTWGDFADLSGSEPSLTIRNEITKGGRSGRVVPVAPTLANYLASVRPPDAVPSDRVVARWRSVSGAGHAIHLAEIAAVEAGKLPQVFADTGARAHLFRKGFIQGLRALGGNIDAVEVLVGHTLDGVKANYIDTWPEMVAAVALVPPLPLPAQGAGNVVRLYSKR
jgi:integrase